VVLYSRLTGIEVSPFAAIYQLGFVFTSILAGFAGLWISYRLLRSEYGPGAATGAVVCGTLGLSLGYYIWFWPTMAHASGFFAGAVFVAVAVRWRDVLRCPSSGLRFGQISFLSWAMGGLLGLACMIRYTNVVLIWAPVVFAICAFREAPASNRRSIAQRTARSVFWAAVGAVLAFAPQLWAWKAIYGSWVVNTYEAHRMYGYPRHWLRVLFTGPNSLLLWTPMAAAACVGLARAVSRGTALGLAGAAVLLSTLYVYSAWSIPGLGASYGARSFVDVSVFLMVGIAELVCWARAVDASRWRRRWIAATLTILTLWNLFFALAWRAGLQTPDGPYAGGHLFRNWTAWGAQLRADLNIRRMLRKKRFPLMTPASEAYGAPARRAPTGLPAQP